MYTIGQIITNPTGSLVLPGYVTKIQVTVYGAPGGNGGYGCAWDTNYGAGGGMVLMEVQ